MICVACMFYPYNRIDASVKMSDFTTWIILITSSFLGYLCHLYCILYYAVYSCIEFWYSSELWHGSRESIVGNGLFTWWRRTVGGQRRRGDVFLFMIYYELMLYCTFMNYKEDLWIFLMEDKKVWTILFWIIGLQFRSINIVSYRQMNLFIS